jgi:hypothetical protein
MPDQDEIAAQQALLQAHRQTLDVLLIQQAQLGAAYAPPAIVNGIRAARDAIVQIKRTLGEWGVPVADSPNDAAPAAPADDLAAPRPGVGAAQVSGDMIVANIGAGAQGVVVGKHIQQTITADSAAGQDADRQAIELLLAQLERELAASPLDAATKMMADFQLRLLAGELGKSGERASPSASTTRQVGDWLLDNLPGLKGALTALFSAPATLRALRRADAPLDAWLQRRFGV